MPSETPSDSIRRRFPLRGLTRGFAQTAPLMATRDELSEFLASVERRAFKQAQFAVRDSDAALDIVQDAMIKLSENYSDRPAAEFPLLFTRILQNVIHDHFRRQKVRSTWVTLFSALTPAGSGGASAAAHRRVGACTRFRNRDAL